MPARDAGRITGSAKWQNAAFVKLAFRAISLLGAPASADEIEMEL